MDYSDDIFSRVISTRNGVKKVRTDDGKVLFVVSDENGNFAHGETIAEARKDLVFKVVAKFEGKLPESATGSEWIGLYRAVTGACGPGVKHFVETMGVDLAETFTVQDIVKMTKRSYGHEKFAEAAGERS